MLILGVAAAACVALLMWGEAPAASAAEEETATADETFVVNCKFSHQAQVDPIVSPGGTSAHMHDFFANTTTDANSTYATLRAGGTTCSRPADAAAYWIPTVYWTAKGKTTTLQATQGLFYYRLGDKDPDVDVRPHPEGLKVVTDHGSGVNWRCVGGTWSTSPPAQCKNSPLVLRIRFPDCFDGDISQEALDRNFRSNMVYAQSPPSGGPAQCPATHPVPVPQLSTNIQFGISTNRVLTTRGKLTLSSGDPSSMHADFFNAWDQQVLANLVDRCINAGPFTTLNSRPPDCA
jgi:hypothetical protein